MGVFDSGMGGISALREILAQLPGENVIYYGDTAHAPYGTKPPAEVMARVREVMDLLMARQVKAVLIACNTATSVAAATLRAELDLPIIGMEPALKPASELRHGGRILVMATPLTLRLPKFQALMARYGEGAIPPSLPRPDGAGGGGRTGRPGGANYLSALLSPTGMRPWTPWCLAAPTMSFLRAVLRRMLPPETALLDGNAGTVRQLHRVLEQRGFPPPEHHPGRVELLTSGDPAVYSPRMERCCICRICRKRPDKPQI